MRRYWLMQERHFHGKWSLFHTAKGDIHSVLTHFGRHARESGIGNEDWRVVPFIRDPEAGTYSERWG